MNRLLLVLSGCAALSSSAADLNFYDFEGNATGDVFTMKHVNGGEANATATVVTDKTNDANRVLSVSTKSWDTFVEFPLPEGVTGQNFCDLYQTLEFDLYRLETSDNNYMQFVIMLGDDVLYRDNEYPFQGDEETWQKRGYSLNKVKNDATALYIGLHNDKADYYLDNLHLSGLPSQSTGTVTWTGSVSDMWDMASTANFTDGTAATMFNEGNSAVFDDTPGADQTVRLNGKISAYDVTFANNRHSYTLLPGDNGGTLYGRGTLTVDNGGDVTMGVANELEGGTILKNGRLRIASLDIAAGFGKSVNVTDGALDFCINNNSDKYAVIETPITLDGNTLDVYTSRYTYWMSPVSGTGDINLYCGGERSYLGHQKNKTQPDWSNYSGTVTLYPYKEVIDNAGFYGVIFEGNKAFNPEDYENHRTNHVLENCKVVATAGTALATEGNDRGVRIGELQLDKDARLYGYYKSKNTAYSYFILGNLGTDAVLAGRMCPTEKDGAVVNGQLLGIIKEGKGTYTITNNTNRLTGGIYVKEGRVLVCNNTEEARAGKLSGATGTMYSDDTKVCQVNVWENGIIGGSGSIAGNVDVFGTLQPGDDNTGTLTLADFEGDTPVALIVRPTTVFEIGLDADGCDKVEVSDAVRYYNRTQDFEESDKMPVIRLTVDEGVEVKDGDEFSIISAKAKEALDDEMKWAFALEAPKGWRLDERVTADSYSVVLIADKNASVENITDSPELPFVDCGNLYVTASENDIIELFTTDGRLIRSVHANAGINVIPVDDINGMFIVSCNDVSAKLTSK